MLESANITAVVDAISSGLSMFTTPPLSYVIIAGVILLGVGVVRKFIRPKFR